MFVVSISKKKKKAEKLAVHVFSEMCERCLDTNTYKHTVCLCHFVEVIYILYVYISQMNNGSVLLGLRSNTSTEIQRPRNELANEMLSQTMASCPTDLPGESSPYKKQKTKTI